MNTKLAIVPAVLLALTAADPHHPSRITSVDPCSLLTASDVSGALELPVEPGKLVGATVCSWQPAKQPPRTIRKVTITLLTPAMYAAMSLSTPNNRWTKTAVTGVGDEAVSATSSNKEDATLAVRKGGQGFVVRVWGFPLDQLLVKERTLAIAAAGRI